MSKAKPMFGTLSGVSGAGALISWSRFVLLALALAGVCWAAAGLPSIAKGQDQTPLWSADMTVVEYTSVSIGAASADLFSNIGGSGNLQIKSLWSHTPDRDLRLAFAEGVPDAADYTLQVGDLSVEFPADSSGNSNFKWNDVDVDWEDGQTIPVSIVPTTGINPPPANNTATGAPTINGTAQVGQTLTADTSGIADADGLTNVSYSYQWLAGGSDIRGATNSSYTLTTSQQGQTIKVRVTFTDDADNEETLTSTGTAAVAAKPNTAATGLPTITGTPQVEQTLTASTSDISDEDGLTNVSYSYQWIAGGTDIAGATGSSYTLTSSEQGQAIQVRVTFTDDADDEETLTSAATAAVSAKANTAPTGLPTIDGTAQVGETLTASTSAIADADGLTNVSYSYQWLAGGNDIAGATGSSYTLTSSEQGKAIQVRVTFTDDADNEESLTSAATAAVTPETNNTATGAPTIDGTAQVGQTLTVDTSGIADADGLGNVSYSFQWVANDGSSDTDVEGATGSTYLLSDDDVGKTVKVKATFTDDGNNAETLTSEATPTVVVKGECPVGGFDPASVEVEVTAVPIIVESTTADYFVLYVRPGLNADREIVASVTLGSEGTTTLSEQLSALSADRYRVEKYLISDPADIDGDCIDDVSELAEPVGMNPLNAAPAIEYTDGAVAVPDRATFEALAYQPETDAGDTDLLNAAYLNFVIIAKGSSRPAVYFANTKTHLTHHSFASALPVSDHPVYGPAVSRGQGLLIGEIAFHPNVAAPDGSTGVYSFRVRPWDPYRFNGIALAYELLAASMPVLDDNFAYYPMSGNALGLYQEEKTRYDASRIDVIFEEDVLPDVDFIPLNPGEGYGFLQLMELEDRPSPLDVVIYETLPNELSRVAGIITTVPQTPLSHVNLRAVQDAVPNAFIRDALDNDDIVDLIDSYVHYSVTADGYSVRAATRAEAEAHFAALRPSGTLTPERDLTVTEIADLDDIGFEDWDAFGVKAANVAELGKLDFTDGTVPDGFAVPFYFYDEFMKHNEFYDDVEELLEDADFQSDYDVQKDELKKLRKEIKKGETPAWIIDALKDMHGTYPEGQSLRYRSSTNNEDLPGFSGAGLYDSKTQDPDETEEDGIDKSIKAVWASLWNFRAFVERDLHGIDHMATAMGVLVHPNYREELANGVAVSFDPLYGTDGSYYVNTQLGEDLVTNPEAHSVPEEILLDQSGTYTTLATSNQVDPGELLMSDAQMVQLRGHLETIHDHFEELYDPGTNEPFAIEIEFKITSDDVLAIKQARPWVFPNRLATGAPTISGTAQAGETLTADTSGITDEDGLDDVEFSYQWLVIDGPDGDHENIVDANDLTYVLTSDDVGKTVKVRVTFTDDRGYLESLTSTGTAAVAAKPNTAPTGLPTISGTDQVGETLTASTSDISDEDGLSNVSYSYQWIAGGTDIAGATGSSYTLTSSEQGQTIQVRVTFTDDADNEETLTSAATEAVKARANSWSATMTVDTRNGFTGYSYWDNPHMGTLSPTEVEWDEKTHHVRYIFLKDDEVRLGLNEEMLSTGFVLSVGDQEFGSAEAIVDKGGASYRFRWDDPGLGWSEGNEVEVSLVESDQNTPAFGGPAVNGTPQATETLTADVSSIQDADGLANATFTYQWITSDGATDTDMENETGPTYTLADDDIGQLIRVRVTFSDDRDHEETLTSAATAEVVTAATEPGVPVRLDVFPHESGALDVYWDAPASDGGSAITGYKVQWKESADSWETPADVSEATTNETNHSITGLTNGVEYTVRVTAVNDVGAGQSSADASATPQGEAIWAILTVGTTENFAGYTTFAPPPQSNILGGLSRDTATLDDTSYTVKALGVLDGKLILAVEPRLNTKFVLAIGKEEFASTKATIWESSSLIQFRWSNPGLDWSERERVRIRLTESEANTPATGLPGINGTPQVDQVLTADTSEIDDADGLTNVSYSYQWIAGGLDIAAATGSSYTPTSSDQGKTIQVRVTFTDDADNEESLTSEATEAVAAAPNRDATGAPTISGTPQVGETLRASTSAITDQDGLTNVSYEYQWISGGTDISGATGSTYTLTASQQGQTIQVRVTFTDDADYEESLTSEATEVVAAKPVPLTVSVTAAAQATHDGSSEFTFEIEFSEEFGLSYKTLRDHAFTVTGGSVEKAQRKNKPSNISWRITVKPVSSGDDVVIELPATTDCNAQGAICTGDGRMLSNSLSITVSGPQP